MIRSINLPVSCELTYPQPDSYGHGFYENMLEDKIINWLEKSKIKYNYVDVIDTTPMLWFETEEDKVRFILRWV